MAADVKEIAGLNTQEKIELAEALWKSIETDRSQPLTEAQKTLLEKRLKEHALNPSAGKTWAEIKEKYAL